MLCVTMCYIMDTLTIRIPHNLKKNLYSLSKQEKKPLSDIVRESLKRYTVTEKFRSLRKKVLPFAEAQGYITDEDIFKIPT